MMNSSNIQAKKLLFKARSERGFLASAENITNYKRIWARDGVICGLAALLDGDEELIETFKKTLQTLANYQHALGQIPSNVYFKETNEVELSFGGLAGRVDTISWFIIGVCNYCWMQNDDDFLSEVFPNIEKGLQLLEAWEFNNNDLLYVPRSGNWADEYITEGHTFYDQVLRLWALRCVQKLRPSASYQSKIDCITEKLEGNYRKNDYQTPFHPKAYQKLSATSYWMASVNPSGYQTMFDAFGNSIAQLLKLGDSTFQKRLTNYTETLRESLPLQLLPAFWKPIKEADDDWKLLVNNCKYEFRNHPYEFHNGGTWQMINGFYGMSLVSQNYVENPKHVLKAIQRLNAEENDGFYENFNTKTGKAIGVPQCTWSAAGELLLEQYINGKRLLV
ncbi:alkaline and neutral invertase [Kordia sp. SMS9]|uniref:glycoside hydrolase 100 family protein n=1 Tax=Kordia sp. SMS9 TaxID=2282170 RepID=UPI000E0CE91C|nr:glycoside hydrolase 100 family protein [Kordia sp. SMS9]AXG70699.1 alkaline and neutral invertase [Kordia sp. SMS9]